MLSKYQYRSSQQSNRRSLLMLEVRSCFIQQELLHHSSKSCRRLSWSPFSQEVNVAVALVSHHAQASEPILERRGSEKCGVICGQFISCGSSPGTTCACGENYEDGSLHCVNFEVDGCLCTACRLAEECAGEGAVSVLVFFRWLVGWVS